LRVFVPALPDSRHAKTARKSKACEANEFAPNSAPTSRFFRLATSISQIDKQKIPVPRNRADRRRERQTIF